MYRSLGAGDGLRRGDRYRDAKSLPLRRRPLTRRGPIGQAVRLASGGWDEDRISEVGGLSCDGRRVWIAVAAIGLAGCSGDLSSVDVAKARVSTKEKAVTQAEADLEAASGQFCDASETYIWRSTGTATC